jgi:CubicO group peptidase (beta-lactamase class C family)
MVTAAISAAAWAVHQDRPVHLRGFGARQAGRPEPVDPDTVFQLASMSKPIASTVVAALAGDGLLAWDDPILRHDPAFAMHDAWVTRQVTLRDMFCHRSGLPGHAGDALEDLGYRPERLFQQTHEVGMRAVGDRPLAGGASSRGALN